MVHHGIRRRLLVRHQAWVAGSPQGVHAGAPGMLVGLRSALAVLLLLLQLLPGAQFCVLELLHMEVLALSQQLLPLLLQLWRKRLTS